MPQPLAAMHWTMVLVDVASFTHPNRTMVRQTVVRTGLYMRLKAALAEAGIDWDACYHEDRGDGVLILVSAHVPPMVLVDPGRDPGSRRSRIGSLGNFGSDECCGGRQSVEPPCSQGFTNMTR
jgi:hypothetical protein